MESIRRYEVDIPEGGNLFLQVPKPIEARDHCQVFLRVTSGRSFLSGFPDTVFFDGVISIELFALGNSKQVSIGMEGVSHVIDKMKTYIPECNIYWDKVENVIHVGLLDNIEDDVTVSSPKILSQIEKGLGLPPQSLVNQAPWILRVY